MILIALAGLMGAGGMALAAAAAHTAPGAVLDSAAYMLLFHAVAVVGGVALLIDAKNERAARWYHSYGALALDDAPLSLVLPLATAADAIKRGI